MVRLQKQYETENMVAYNYYPNNGTEYGTFSVDKTTLNFTVECLDPIYPELFFFKALIKVKDMIANNDCKNEASIIWY